jgi:hypothetical protein
VIAEVPSTSLDLMDVVEDSEDEWALVEMNDSEDAGNWTVALGTGAGRDEQLGPARLRPAGGRSVALEDPLPGDRVDCRLSSDQALPVNEARATTNAETFVVREGTSSRVSASVEARCALCFQVFAAGGNLARQHERTCHPRSSFGCRSCSKICSCSEDLRRHSRTTGHAISEIFRIDGVTIVSSAQALPGV